MRIREGHRSRCWHFCVARRATLRPTWMMIRMTFVFRRLAFLSYQLSHHHIASFLLKNVTNNRPAVSRTVAMSMAEWAPADGKWEEKDYEAELSKLEKEAEDRLDAKIAELMTKVETTGAN